MLRLARTIADLDGGDLRDEAYDAITATIERTVLTNCPEEYPEDWDLDELHLQMTANYPTRITREQLDQCSHRDMLVALFTDDAVETRDEAREQALSADRVMLGIGNPTHAYDAAKIPGNVLIALKPAKK